jgi:hypothetical protein
MPEEPTTDPNQLVYLDVRYVRNPASAAGNLRYRVAVGPGWKAKFSLLFEDTIVAPQVLQAVVTDAGKLVGLGDGRTIGFGRFEVASYDEAPFDDAPSASA